MTYKARAMLVQTFLRGYSQLSPNQQLLDHLLKCRQRCQNLVKFLILILTSLILNWQNLYLYHQFKAHHRQRMLLVQAGYGVICLALQTRYIVNQALTLYSSNASIAQANIKFVGELLILGDILIRSTQYLKVKGL